MRSRSLTVLFFLVTLFCLPASHASETPAEHAASVYAQNELDTHPVLGNIPDYSLSPADLAKSQHLHAVDMRITAVNTVWGVLSIALLLWLGVVAWMRDVAVRSSRNRWLQGTIFTGLFVLAGFLLDLPLKLYGHHLGLAYGFSVQHWPGWFGDQAKSLAIEWIVTILLAMLLFWVIRRFPTRWWAAFWVASIPITIFAVFVSPYVNFLFNSYEPLAKNNAALAQRLEEVVSKGNMNIPIDRMYLMKASAKVTTLNADVEGFGASKRVVVWDTTVQRMTPDEVVAVFGHESGHYVLNHIRSGAIQSFAIVFISLWLSFLLVRWSLARFGPAWRIPDQNDWGTLAVLALAFSFLGLAISPLSATLSRAKEHAADVYGQEAIHGLVPDPQVAMQGTMQKLGKATFDPPNVPHWEEDLLDGHPATGRRAAFAHAYNPWAPGMEPKYFKQ